MGCKGSDVYGKTIQRGGYGKVVERAAVVTDTGGATDRSERDESQSASQTCH